MSKPRADQLLAGFAEGDAISAEALLLQEQFRQMGCESEIYAEAAHVEPRLRDRCRELKDHAGGPQDILLCHYSIGSPATQTFQQARARKILLYHNITPAEYFQGFDDRVARQLVAARNELKAVAESAEAVWADSHFNAAEIQALGIAKTEVLPLLFSPAVFQGPRDPAVEARLSGGLVNWLFVGRIAPNKRVEDLILAFAWYNKTIQPFSRLVLVGSDRSCPRYYAMLRMLAGELDLPNVCFEGFASPEGLAACYASASLFICASEHEGFCLPLVEAMYNQAPVIARNRGGMPEALGGAGVLYEDLSARELAELAHLVVSDPGLRAEVLASQVQRMKEWSGRDARAELTRLLAPFWG